MNERLRALLAAGDAGAVQEAVALARSLALAGAAVEALLQTVREAGAGELMWRSLEAGCAEFLRVREESAARRSAESEERANRALSRSEALFGRLSASGLLAVYVIDLQGRILEANDTFLAMLGYTREELLHTDAWKKLRPPEYAAMEAQGRRELALKGSTTTQEKELVRKDGTRVAVLVGGARLEEDTAVVFALDISARKRLEHVQRDAMELESRNHRMRESNRIKHEFLANMSHELRTPLNAIIGFAELLLEEDDPAPSLRQKEFLDTIAQSGRNLLRMINDVLDLVRVEAGKLDLRPEPIDLIQVTADVIALYRPQAQAKKIRLGAQVHASSRDGLVLDPMRLRQIASALLSNAIKFTPDGGEVFLRALPEGADRLRLEVSDTGVGIAPDVLGKLFRQVYQLESGSSKHQGGAGLGLVLTRALVEAQNGTVSAKSVPGVGSTFSVVLPRAIGTREEPVRPRREGEGAHAILIIEDESANRAMLREALSGGGYSVQTAATAAEALLACSQQRFSAITLDLMLPDMSGFDLLARIRETELNRDTPVIVVSVAADAGMAAGSAVDDVLPKPLSTEALLASLRRVGVSPDLPGGVMVVDDDESSLRLMAAALQQLGYTASCFSDSQRALTAATATPPSAIVLDLAMPGIDGFEFLERLRTVPAASHTPVLIWTAQDLTSDELGRLARNSQHVMRKGQHGIDSLLAELRRFTASEATPGGA